MQTFIFGVFLCHLDMTVEKQSSITYKGSKLKVACSGYPRQQFLFDPGKNESLGMSHYTISVAKFCLFICNWASLNLLHILMSPKEQQTRHTGVDFGL